MDSYYTLDESLLTLLNMNELTGYKVINLYSFFATFMMYFLFTSQPFYNHMIIFNTIQIRVM